jgi:sugar lactone lactonase YvrE
MLGVAVDANGGMAVSVQAGPSRIYLYNAPVGTGATPRDSINYLGFGALLAFGPGGKLFVPTSSTNILIYTPPFTNGSIPDTIKTGLANSFSIAFDASNRLYVGDISDQVVHVYDSPYMGAPAFNVSNGLISAVVTGVAVDGGGRLLVADEQADRIHVFEPPLSAASTESFAISIGIKDPVGITLGSDGRLYVMNQGGGKPSVTIYDPPFSDISVPTITMSGGGRLVSPYGIAVGTR